MDINDIRITNEQIGTVISNSRWRKLYSLLLILKKKKIVEIHFYTREYSLYQIVWYIVYIQYNTVCTRDYSYLHVYIVYIIWVPAESTYTAIHIILVYNSYEYIYYSEYI